jgi:hypothetical protein
MYIYMPNNLIGQRFPLNRIEEIQSIKNWHVSSNLTCIFKKEEMTINYKKKKEYIFPLKIHVRITKQMIYFKWHDNIYTIIYVKSFQSSSWNELSPLIHFNWDMRITYSKDTHQFNRLEKNKKKNQLDQFGRKLIIIIILIILYNIYICFFLACMPI